MNKSDTNKAEQLNETAVSKSALKFEYGFSSVNGIIKKQYYLHEIPSIKEKCDVWNVLPIAYVRQFTGLFDKNEKEIFDNDIVFSKYHNKTMIIFFGNDLRYRLSDNLTYLDENSYAINETSIEEGFEKLGNIFENSELLQTTS